MAFPQVSDADTQSGLQSTNSTSWTLTYPTNLVSGDLILAFVATDGVAVPTWPSGWRAEDRGSGDNELYWAKKLSDGTETGNFTLTLDATQQGCWRVLRITGWQGTLGTVWDNITNGGAVIAPRLNPNIGTDTAPDSPSLDPANWGVEDTLWFAIASSDHGNTTYTGFPTGWTNTSAQESGGANGAALGTARLERALASIDPGVFTTDASEGWGAITLAIRPLIPRGTPNFAQAQATIRGTAFAFGQTRAAIKAIGNRFAQVQGKLNAFDQGQFGQAQVDIKATGYGLGQSNTDIKATYYGLGQAQGTILQSYWGLGQANTSIRKSAGRGQAQGNITTGIYSASDTFTRTTSNGWGTADVGGDWVVSGGASTHSTDGFFAHHSGVVSSISESLPKVVSKGINEVIVDFQIDSLSGNNTIYFSSVTGKTNNGGVGLSLSIVSSGAATLRVNVGVGGSFDLGTLSTLVFYRLKAHTNINPYYTSIVRSRVKLWEKTSSEPGWQLDITQSPGTQFDLARPQIYIAGAGTSTFAFDNFSFSNIGWTESAQAQAKIESAAGVSAGFGQAQASILQS